MVSRDREAGRDRNCSGQGYRSERSWSTSTSTTMRPVERDRHAASHDL